MPDHTGNIQPQLDLEEHDHTNTAKRVTLAGGSASTTLGSVNIRNSDGTDNSYTTGGVYGQKVHVVGISDIYAEGTIAVGSSLTGHKPLAGGFKNASGNNEFVTGDTTNGLDVDVTRLPSLVAGTANIGKIIQSNVLVPADHDYIGLTYTGSNLTTATFKTGGSGGTVVATLTLAYTGSRLDSVTKT